MTLITAGSGANALKKKNLLSSELEISAGGSVGLPGGVHLARPSQVPRICPDPSEAPPAGIPPIALVR